MFCLPRVLGTDTCFTLVVPGNAGMSHGCRNVKASVEIWWDPLSGTNLCLLWQTAEPQGIPACPQQPCSPLAAITQALATEQLLKRGKDEMAG